MRLTDFWERMDAVLGRSYARTWAAEQHMSSLGGRTVDQALADGVDTRDVWRAVCEHAPVPSQLR